MISMDNMYKPANMFLAKLHMLAYHAERGIMSEFNKRQYNNEYNKANYKQVNFRLTPDTYETLSKQATEKGFSSINAYAKILLEAALADNPNPDSCRGGGRN